ncbi:sensor histidine kinase [Ottowia flava]
MRMCSRFPLIQWALPWRLSLVVVALLALVAWRPALAQSAAPVRIGVLAYLGNEAAVEEWSPVVTQLSKALPGRSVELRLLAHEGLVAAAKGRDIDFVITNPGHYVELESRVGASRILTLQTGDAPGSADQAIGTAVVTRSDDQRIQRLADLRSQRVAIVGEEGFAGFQVAWRELAAEGIEPTRDLDLRTVGLPMDRVLTAVSSGQADAGFVRACMIEAKPEWRARFRVVAPRHETGFACASSTRLYPNWPIATLRHTDPELARAVTIALLEMRREDSPIVWTVPADYQAVHDLQRELQIGSYAGLRTPTMTAIVRRYWPWIVGLFALIGLGGLYTFHVERQVDARTADLRAAARERQALEAHLQQSREQAEHLARLSVLGELSGTLAHELNQPLAAIGNYAQSLIRRADNQRLTPETVREAAGEMAGQAERAAGVLGRIRSFAKKRVAQRTHVSPDAVVRDAVALFRGMQAGAPPVDVVDELPPGTTVSMDGLQIQQVLLNLLKNGWDATRELPPERQRLSVRLSLVSGQLRIEVRDLGDPLADAQQSQLFEPFFTTKPDGMGLGLAICRTIAEAHGGRLDAAPAANPPGLVFSITLPHDVRAPLSRPAPLADSSGR